MIYWDLVYCSEIELRVGLVGHGRIKFCGKGCLNCCLEKLLIVSINRSIVSLLNSARAVSSLNVENSEIQTKIQLNVGAFNQEKGSLINWRIEAWFKGRSSRDPSFWFKKERTTTILGAGRETCRKEAYFGTKPLTYGLAKQLQNHLSYKTNNK